MNATDLRTGRLLLRHWRESDREPFALLNADPNVMEYFPAPLTRAESEAMVLRIEDCFDRRGFGLWAVEVRATATFAGFVGLWPATFEAHFTPAVEVGWRLAHAQWGLGLRPRRGKRRWPTASNGSRSRRSCRSPPPVTNARDG